jgi:hypothetical protein
VATVIAFQRRRLECGDAQEATDRHSGSRILCHSHIPGRGIRGLRSGESIRSPLTLAGSLGARAQFASAVHDRPQNDIVRHVVVAELAANAVAELQDLGGVQQKLVYVPGGSVGVEAGRSAVDGSGID